MFFLIFNMSYIYARRSNSTTSFTVATCTAVRTIRYYCYERSAKRIPSWEYALRWPAFPLRRWHEWTKYLHQKLIWLWEIDARSKRFHKYEKIWDISEEGILCPKERSVLCLCEPITSRKRSIPYLGPILAIEDPLWVQAIWSSVQRKRRPFSLCQLSSWTGT